MAGLRGATRGPVGSASQECGRGVWRGEEERESIGVAAEPRDNMAPKTALALLSLGVERCTADKRWPWRSITPRRGDDRRPPPRGPPRPTIWAVRPDPDTLFRISQ